VTQDTRSATPGPKPAVRRRRDEAGFVVAEWTLAVGLLLLPTIFIVLSFPQWVERTSLARSAAQEASRAVAVANDTASGVERGTEMVSEIAANHGVDPSTVSVSFAGDTTRGSSVTATVTVAMPALSFPGFGSVGSVHWSTSHTELVDQYRGFTP